MEEKRSQDFPSVVAGEVMECEQKKIRLSSHYHVVGEGKSPLRGSGTMQASLLEPLGV